MTIWIKPFTLEGRLVVLSPLTPFHGPKLAQAVEDGHLYRTWHANIPAPEEMSTDIASRLTLQAQGQSLAFTICDRHSNRIVGTTGYINIDSQNNRLGIGDTWISKSAQGTGINWDAKLLLLHHAFEALDCIAVEFRIPTMNTRARCSVERLGARLDGILRAHRKAGDDVIMDTAVYSIIASEWPAVCRNLEDLLQTCRK